jgi:hypothetical protein
MAEEVMDPSADGAFFGCIAGSVPAFEFAYMPDTDRHVTPSGAEHENLLLASRPEAVVQPPMLNRPTQASASTALDIKPEATFIGSLLRMRQELRPHQSIERFALRAPHREACDRLPT